MLARENERIRLAARLHGITLAPAFAVALVLAGAGAVAVVSRWPWTPFGALVVALAAAVALQASWRWERTRVVLTDERLYVVEGTLRRRTTAAPVSAGIQVDQGVLGRLLGYGTLVAGEVEVPFVPRADSASGR
jgi:membrane protein YdbS with pleckstrin-like domain